MTLDLNLLSMFQAVAHAPNFRVAADRLGVTRSAVSQGMRRLENTLGTALVVRTTRAVRLTQAGEQLRDALLPSMTGITAALEQFGAQGQPHGHLKLAVTSIAESFLSGSLLTTFAAAYPAVTIDVTVTDAEFDIVAAGFDAGVRLGEVIERDMIAVPLTGTQREAVVAAPVYLEAHGVPRHPRELTVHRCIGWRPSPDVVPYRWEFSENGRPFDVAVAPQITTNDLRLMLRTALCGGGITFATRDTFAPWLASGELVSLFEDFLPPFPGFYLYYPQRHNMAPKLRALIEHVRAERSAMS